MPVHAPPRASLRPCALCRSCSCSSSPCGTIASVRLMPEPSPRPGTMHRSYSGSPLSTNASARRVPVPSPRLRACCPACVCRCDRLWRRFRVSKSAKDSCGTFRGSAIMKESCCLRLDGSGGRGRRRRHLLQPRRAESRAGTERTHLLALSSERYRKPSGITVQRRE